MCGIAGIFNLQSGEPVEEATLQRMIATMPYRGPDASGTLLLPGGALGHVRLAILDLRPEGNQPFSIDEGDYTIVYNGEVFNYVELRAELEALGHHFHTTTDTEVVIRAYKQWGAPAVRRFNGMWAFAIYDRRRDELFCSRDRFGVKPLYWAEHRGRLIFASEVKAMLPAERELARPDYRSLSLMLRAKIAAETEDTFFEGVKRLEPAHNLIATRKGVRLERYWSYPTEPLEISREQAAERILELLTDSLRIRMRSDVPVGSTLSGGIDSSALACLLRTFDRRPYETFTAAYEGQPFDEAPRAEALARELGMSSNLVPATTREFLETLRKCVFHLDAPTHNPAVLPLWNIMQAMRKKVVVAIEGQGADELFAGYVTQCFPVALADDLRRAQVGQAWRDLRAHSAEWGWPLTLAWTARHLLPWTHRLYRSARGDEPVYTGPLVGLPDRFLPAQAPPAFGDGLTRLLYQQHTGTLRSLLHYGDGISMAHSVESRLPFMDYRLVELAFRLPGSFKLREGHGKAVLKQALRPVVPAWVLDTRAKLGFHTPIAQWFREEPERSVYPVLRDERCRRRGIFDAARLDEALEKHRSGRADLSRHIFRWITTEMWFQEFVDR